MGKQDYSGIVVYTIHGGDEQKPLRDCLRQKISDVFNGKLIDESTYGIPIYAEIRADVVRKLQQICKDAAKESECQFSDEDFVNLYYPTYKEETGDDRRIRLESILCTKNKM